MATFYRPRGHSEPAVLWDKDKGRALYAFYQGVCTTEDPKVIALLRKLGFSEEPISPNIQQIMEVTKDMTAPQPPAPPRADSVPAREPVRKPAAAKEE